MKTLKKGFTLIELLIVVAIIGILATVVILNVSGARKKAQKANVESNMSVVQKIGAACVSFGGSVHQNNTAPSATGATAVCDTSAITDQTEKDSATGNFPVLPTTFKYNTSATTDLVQVVDNKATPTSGVTYTCTTAGCTKGNVWDTF